tara:strand:+ start:122 stop:280 length:159 start_codon:yes stop_codon:yes gene_type:complete
MPRLQPGSPGAIKSKSGVILSSKAVEEVVDWACPRAGEKVKLNKAPNASFEE